MICGTIPPQYAMLSFEGGTSGEGGYDLTIGSGQFIEGFEEKLIGKELGGSYDLALWVKVQ